MNIDTASYDFMQLMCRVDYLEFERLYMQLTEEEQSTLANDAPYGEKGRWKTQLRFTERGFHDKMDVLQHTLSEAIEYENWDWAAEMIVELEDWEVPYLMARLNEDEKQFVKLTREISDE